MITRLWVLATTRAHCVESLSKTIFPPHPGEKKKWVPTNYHVGKVKQTRLCRSSVPPPQQQKYIVESGLNAKEIALQPRALSFGFDFTFTYPSGTSLTKRANLT